MKSDANTDVFKAQAANAALELIHPQLRPTTIIGIGTGSTTNHFIDGLGKLQINIQGAVASSIASAQRLQAFKIPVLDLNDVLREGKTISFYIDGADESNANLELIKGGGGALTREKIIAQASENFICIADETKKVRTLGQFPLPLEVIPMASIFIQQIIRRELGVIATERVNFLTDNGNRILDIAELTLAQPIELERYFNQLPGVVCNGIFAARPADRLILAGVKGLEQITR